MDGATGSDRVGEQVSGIVVRATNYTIDNYVVAFKVAVFNGLPDALESYSVSGVRQPNSTKWIGWVVNDNDKRRSTLTSYPSHPAHIDAKAIQIPEYIVDAINANKIGGTVEDILVDGEFLEDVRTAKNYRMNGQK